MHQNLPNHPDPSRPDAAWSYVNGAPGKTEALGQGEIQRLVRGARDGLLPQPLERHQEKERRQRRQVAKVFDEHQTKPRRRST